MAGRLPLANAVLSPPGKQGKCVFSTQTQLSMRSLHTLAFSKKGLCLFNVIIYTICFSDSELGVRLRGLLPSNHRLWPVLRSGAWSPAAEGGCQSFHPLTTAGWWLYCQKHSLPQGLFSNSKWAVKMVLSLGHDQLRVKSFQMNTYLGTNYVAGRKRIPR